MKKDNRPKDECRYLVSANGTQFLTDVVSPEDKQSCKDGYLNILDTREGKYMDRRGFWIEVDRVLSTVPQRAS